MREAAFLQKEAEKWRQFESLLANPGQADPDRLADLFVELTDDLSYARTFYPESNTAAYLNQLTSVVHQRIYRNRRERSGCIGRFWKYELPLLYRRYHRTLLLSSLIFAIGMTIFCVTLFRYALTLPIPVAPWLIGY